jgi:hypothetical protein
MSHRFNPYRNLIAPSPAKVGLTLPPESENLPHRQVFKQGIEAHHADEDGPKIPAVGL